MDHNSWPIVTELKALTLPLIFIFVASFNTNTGLASPNDRHISATASLTSSGGKATSANYSDEATVGDIVGTSTGAGASVSLKSGFIGQLDEARSLAVSAAPAAVVESGTTQLSAVATMDDDSLVRLGGSALMGTNV
jgi:uncharacterized protein YbjT (DUF2867 family)